MKLDVTFEKIKEIFLVYSPKGDARTKIEPLNFIAAFVFCLVVDENRKSLASIRRKLMELTSQKITRSTFFDRISTQRLKKALERILSSLMTTFSNQLEAGEKILEALNIKKLLILDSTSCGLPKEAKDKFPAPRNNVCPAGIKSHVLLNPFSGVFEWFKLTPATTHDRKGFPPLKLLKGALIIFDLGYWDFSLFRDLINSDVFFLSRIKSGSQMIVKKVVSGWPKKFEGFPLLGMALPEKKEKIVEVIVEHSFKANESIELRAIGFLDEKKLCYHWYITNLKSDPKFIYPLYRLRWAIELSFKACKTSLHLDEIQSSNETIITNLLLGGLISYFIGKTILVEKINENIKKKIKPQHQVKK